MESSPIDSALKKCNGRVTASIVLPSQIGKGQAHRTVVIIEVSPDLFQVVDILKEIDNSQEEHTFLLRGKRGRDRTLEDLGCPADSEAWLRV